MMYTNIRNLRYSNTPLINQLVNQTIQFCYALRYSMFETSVKQSIL